MAIETVDGMTAAERRVIVRDLCHITTNSHTDAELDRRIEQGDAAARLKWPNNTVPDGAADKRAYITLANLETAIMIITGTAKPEAIEMAKIYTQQCKRIIESLPDITDNPQVSSARMDVTGSRRGTFT